MHPIKRIHPKSIPSKSIIIVFCAFLLISCKSEKQEDIPWVKLFDGATLKGWTQKGGAAIYKVSDSTIIGSTVADTPNSFLTTNAMYSDFILELEFKVDSTMNSGIQIRSNSFPDYREGQVHGYQIEIDPSERAWSAGIYDEGRSGWLHPVADDNIAAKKAFKQNDWNHYRIEAFGDTLKTWINGVAAAHLIDEQTASGFIGLQVHSIAKEQKAGTEITWRNIHLLTEGLEKYVKQSPLPAIIKKESLETTKG